MRESKGTGRKEDNPKESERIGKYRDDWKEFDRILENLRECGRIRKNQRLW